MSGELQKRLRAKADLTEAFSAGTAKLLREAADRLDEIERVNAGGMFPETERSTREA